MYLQLFQLKQVGGGWERQAALQICFATPKLAMFFFLIFCGLNIKQEQNVWRFRLSYKKLV